MQQQFSPNIRITAPTCVHCLRLLIVVNGRCLCCGKGQK